MGFFEAILDNFRSFLTPLIAGIAVWIAYQQFQTNVLKVRLDLFDRRMAVYEGANALLYRVMRDANIEWSDVGKFDADTHNAVFLFKPEVTDYLATIRLRALELATACAEYRDSTQDRPENYDHQDVVRRKHEALRWLAEQPVEIKTLFKKHMNLAS